MRAIVTGATGFLGSHLVEMLRFQGWNVIAIGRDKIKGRALENSEVKYRSADITQLTQLHSIFEEVDVVFHCAAMSTAWGDYEQFYSINVEGTRNLLACAREYRVRRFIYVSSSSVYFDFSDRKSISEQHETAYPFVNAYSETKYLGEKVVLEESGQNMEKVIIRPRGIVGAGDTSIVPRILRFARKGWFPLIRNGEAVVDVTHVGNVAYAMVLAASAEAVDGQCFNISNNEPLPVRTLLTRIFNVLDISAKLIPLPYSLIISWTILQEKFYSTFIGKEPPLTRYGVGLLSHSQVLDTAKARELLGYVPQYSLNDAFDSYRVSEGYSLYPDENSDV